MNLITSAIAKLVALYRREPAATQTAAAIVYGGALVLYRAFAEHTAPVDWQVITAAVVALYGLLVRAQVIPTVKATQAGVVPAAPSGAAGKVTP
jgi:hypothetical protein